MSYNVKLSTKRNLIQRYQAGEPIKSISAATNVAQSTLNTSPQTPVCAETHDPLWPEQMTHLGR